MKRSLFVPLALVSFFFAPAVGSADPGLISFTGGTPFPGYSSNETIGLRFQVIADSPNVTHLGLYDQFPADPLVESHLVGLWNDVGVLLGQVTVQTNSPLTGSFRYEPLTTSVALSAGAFYRIGAQFDLSGSNDSYISSATSVTMAPNFSFDRAYNSPDGTGFAFPNSIPVTGGPVGRFGPNFLFRAVPEPSSLVLVGLGASLLTYRRLRSAFPRH